MSVLKNTHGNYGYFKSFHSFVVNMESIEDRIVKSASELFLKYGLRNVTMDDIANNLGISKKTLYKYYQNKNEIVVNATIYSIKCHQNEQDKIVSQSSNAIDEMLQIMNYAKNLFTQMHATFILELNKYFPLAWKHFLKHKEDFIQKKIKNNLQRGIREGLYRSDINVVVITKLRMDQMLSADITYYSENGLSQVEVQMQMLEHYLYGICSLKGYKLVEKYKVKIKS